MRRALDSMQVGRAGERQRQMKRQRRQTRGRGGRFDGGAFGAFERLSDKMSSEEVVENVILTISDENNDSFSDALAENVGRF